MKKLNIFAAIQVFNWEKLNLIDTLRDMGHTVHHFDFRALGYNQYSCDWEAEKKKEMNELMLKEIGIVHAKKPIDLFFGYLSDPVVEPDVISEIKSYHIATLNFGCNDINSFERGHIKIAPFFNLNWTTNKHAVNKYEDIHANIIYMPYGINENFYKINERREPPKLAYDISFIGQPYGYRLPFFFEIVNKGLSYALLGKVTYKRLIRTILESRVCLGFSGLIGYNFDNQEMKQLRLRDFEVPAIGGLYLTERMDYITELFEENKEMLFYSSIDELVDKAIFYSRYKNRKARNNICRAARIKCVQEYTWKKQFTKIFKRMNLA